MEINYIPSQLELLLTRFTILPFSKSAIGG
jgi:hypothetical protein